MDYHFYVITHWFDDLQKSYRISINRFELFNRYMLRLTLPSLMDAKCLGYQLIVFKHRMHYHGCKGYDLNPIFIIFPLHSH